jgi:hypothetical protein
MDLASVKHIYSSQRQKEQKAVGEASTAAAPAAAAAPAPASAAPTPVPPAATTPAPQQQGMGMSLAAMAAAAGNAAAAAGPKAPAAAAAPAGAASTPASAGTWSTGGTSAGATAAPGMSDDDILAAGVAAGADEAALCAVLSSTSSGKYQRIFVRMLALAGPEGSSVREMAVKAVEVGLESWDGESSTVKNGLSRYFNLDCVAALGNAKYALKCFPGVVDTRGPGRGGKKAYGGGGSGPSSAAPSGALPDGEDDVVIVDS